MRWAAAPLVTVFCSAAIALPNDKEFSAKDLVEWGTIQTVTSGGDFAEYYRPSGRIAFSPAGSRFVVRTQAGDVEGAVLRDRLHVYDTDTVRRYLASPAANATSPSPRASVEQSIEVEAKQIRNIGWVNEDELRFVGTAADGSSQGFILQVASGRVLQVTQHPTAVMSMAVAGDRVVYFAAVPESAKPRVRWAGDQSLGNMLVPASDGGHKVVELYVSSRSGNDLRKVDMPPIRAKWYLHKIWISPSARYAVTRIPAVNWPLYWQEYHFDDCRLWCFSPDRRASDPTSNQLIQRQQYALVDLQTLTIRPLLDAPTGLLVTNGTPPEVFWSTDETKVIVSSTFLPLNGVDAETRRERRKGPAIAAVDIASGQAAAIVMEPAGPKPDQSSVAYYNSGNAIQSVSWNPRSGELRVSRQRSDGSLHFDAYRKSGDKWQRYPLSTRKTRQDLTVRVRQGLEQRPKLFVADADCNCEKVLLDPNPHADQYAFSPTRIHTWKDSTGRTWRGGLMYPANYQPEKRYPLVVQNHGFDPQQYLVDGPEEMHTAFAARAFAQAGMAVLQIEENAQIEQSAVQSKEYADAYHAGIVSLIQAGIVDERKVGIIGFSSTGLGVLQLLADYPGTVAAAVIADASMNGYMTQLDNVDLLQDFKAQSDAAGLVSPLSMPIMQWWKENPLPRIAEGDTAILLQTIDAGATVHEWEIYALMRGRGKPVDLLYIPFGSHSLFNPRERFASQGSSVEWFKLWLGQDGVDKAGAEGMKAWRRLREKYGALVAPKTHLTLTLSALKGGEGI